MPLKEYTGNLFDSSAQTFVNTVNCVGVMGKGVALEFRRRFPEMFVAYREACDKEMLKPGQILPYQKGSPWVLNFAVKNDWKYPSRMEWVQSCLERFVANYRELGITSVAMPWLGAMNGGLPWNQVHELMRSHLKPLTDIDVEIVEFDPDASDPIFRRIEAAVRSMDAGAFGQAVGITRRAAEAIWRAVVEESVPSLSRLIELPGLGKKTVEHLYAHFRAEQTPRQAPAQPTLFD
jgi:O-acetyl-ADP-ribose deacetylase (regulator of RNase III)